MTTLPMSDASGGCFFHISLNDPAHVHEKPRVSLDLTSGAKIEQGFAAGCHQDIGLTGKRGRTYGSARKEQGKYDGKLRAVVGMMQMWQPKFR